MLSIPRFPVGLAYGELTEALPQRISVPASPVWPPVAVLQLAAVKLDIKRSCARQGGSSKVAASWKAAHNQLLREDYVLIAHYYVKSLQHTLYCTLCSPSHERRGFQKWFKHIRRAFRPLFKLTQDYLILVL